MERSSLSGESIRSMAKVGFNLTCEPVKKCVQTLQDACRAAIVKSVTLPRMQQVGELPIPDVLLRRCVTSFRIPEDFDLEKVFMSYNFSFPNHVHHSSHRIHPAICKLDNSKVLIKSHFVNNSCENCKVFGSKNFKNNHEKWMDLRHENLMNCLFTMYEPALGLFCYVLEFPLMTLQDFAYTVHVHGNHIPEFLIWRTLYKLCNVFEYLRKFDIDASDLCQPQHMYIDETGEVKLENMLLYTQLDSATIVHSNMASFYNPPEKLTGLMSKPDSTQVWGLGCVLYELTTYMPEYVTDDMNVALVSIDNVIYPMDYGKVAYSRLLQLVITSCLEDQPSKRPSLSQLKQQSYDAVQRLEKGYTGPTNLLALYPLESIE